MDKRRERRTLEAFLAARRLPSTSVQPHERPDFLMQCDGQPLGIEVTRLIEASPRQKVAPQQWEAEAQRACRDARRVFEAVCSDSVVVHLQFRPDCGVGELREPGLPADLAAVVSKHLRMQTEPWPLQSDPLVRDPHPVLTMLYAARLATGGESDWRLGGASSARPAKCEDVLATVAGKEPLVAIYREAAKKVWLLIDCDLLGQGVSLLVPDAPCRLTTTFDAVFCIDFYSSWRAMDA